MRSCHDLQTEARLPRRLSRFAFEREISACAENCSCVWSASSVRGGIFSAPQHVRVLTDCDMTALTARVQGARQGELLRATPAPRSCGRKQVGAYKEFCLLILIRSETWVSSLGHCSTTPKSQHPTSQMGHPVMTPRLRLVSGGAHVPGSWQMLVIAAGQSFFGKSSSGCPLASASTLRKRLPVSLGHQGPVERKGGAPFTSKEPSPVR